ncbi:MAG: acyl-CoA dehydrogenase [Nocardioides sp.]|nr:acyl-CoA dehydrogenase [Nocardioides sp.]
MPDAPSDRVVGLRSPASPSGPLLAELATACPGRLGDVASYVALARAWSGRFPLPAGGRTALRWEMLATLGAHDLQLARTVEPHVDALAILAEAGAGVDVSFGGDGATGETYGVFASETPGHRLSADGDPVRLTGDKAWCSLGTELSSGLVTAWVDDTRRGLFVVDLRHPGVHASDDPWVARGLRDVRSTALSFDAVAATPLGAPGWYLERDGFAHGGLGVAAVWYGAAVALWRRLALPSGRPPDQVARMHVGRAHVSLQAARALLQETAGELDAGRGDGAAGAVLAHTVRAAVAGAAEDVLARCEHGLGPAPLVAEEEHAARVADLRLYLRQHHAERDEAALGALLLDGGRP